jgi:hypothetical protein
MKWWCLALLATCAAFGQAVDGIVIDATSSAPMAGVAVEVQLGDKVAAKTATDMRGADVDGGDAHCSSSREKR